MQRRCSAPRNRVYIEIAPPTLAFETFSPASACSRWRTTRWSTSRPAIARVRRTCAGAAVRRQGRSTADHPGVAPLQLPDDPAQHRAALVPRRQRGVHGDLDGRGLGRAQGGYDEMVFRAMVRDDAQFYDPLGLVSNGTEVDFQVGANAYLYGTRFMSYLALEYGPEKLVDWWRRDEGSRDATTRMIRAGVRQVSSIRPGRTGSPSSTSSSAKNLAAVREHPITPHATSRDAGSGALSRAFVSDDGRTLYAAVRYPGRVPHLVSHLARGRQRHRARGGQGRGAVSRDLAGLRSRGAGHSSTRPTTSATAT